MLLLKKQLIQMKVLLTLVLVTFAFSEPVLLVVSNVDTTTVISPSNQQVDLSRYYSINFPNFLGFGPQWIWLKGPNGWAHQYRATFQTLFYSTCPGVPATLTLQVDDVYSVFLNGAPIGSGNIKQTLSFKLNLICGLNNLTFAVMNLGENTPGALIFKVSQSQEQCHKCTPSAYFDADSCQCKCSAELSCPSSLKVKVGYPICGCKCLNRLFASCPHNKEYDQQICQCQCRKIKCLDGFQQDPKSCVCRCKALNCPQ